MRPGGVAGEAGDTTPSLPSFSALGLHLQVRGWNLIPQDTGRALPQSQPCSGCRCLRFPPSSRGRRPSTGPQSGPPLGSQSPLGNHRADGWLGPPGGCLKPQTGCSPAQPGSLCTGWWQCHPFPACRGLCLLCDFCFREMWCTLVAQMCCSPGQIFLVLPALWSLLLLCHVRVWGFLPYPPC